jgi:RNA polymerase sigma-70 factor (ECF subfamily)
VGEGILVISGDKVTTTRQDKSAECSRWIKAAQAGDLAAFRELIVLHQRQVLLTAFRLLGQLDLAQDAAQEVFLRLHKYLHRFKEERNFAPWLYQMILNVCRDLRRQSQKNQAVSLEELSLDENFEISTPMPDPQAQFLQAEKRRLVGIALERLPEKEREAIVLRDIEGLSTKEVAGILGSTEGTVRVQLCSARLKIKKQLHHLLGKKP